MSPRLFYHPISEEDFDDLYALTKNEHVREFLMEGLEISPEECKELILKSRILFAADGVGLYLIKEKDTFVGYCGFMEPHDPSKYLDVVYAFPEKFTGKGFATEACKALIDLAARSKLKRPLTAVVHPQNRASIHVLEKCGFNHTGAAPGELSHLLRYAIPPQTPF